MARLYASSTPADMEPHVVADVEDGFRTGFGTAPVWVIAGADDERAERGEQAGSIFPAVQNLLLAATALGLGSAMTTIASYAPKEVADIAGLPRHVRPYAMIPIGWPAKPLGPPRRRPVTEIAHRETFGNPW